MQKEGSDFINAAIIAMNYKGNIIPCKTSEDVMSNNFCRIKEDGIFSYSPIFTKGEYEVYKLKMERVINWDNTENSDKEYVDYLKDKIFCQDFINTHFKDVFNKLASDIRNSFYAFLSQNGVNTDDLISSKNPIKIKLYYKHNELSKTSKEHDVLIDKDNFMFPIEYEIIYRDLTEGNGFLIFIDLYIRKIDVENLKKVNV